MTRLYGSTDLFPDTLVDADRRYQSINFIDCHDGLNLCDLVSYTNEAQRSWNCGYEGTQIVPTEVAAIRRRQVRNFCCLLMLSNGVPMFVAGDVRSVLQTVVIASAAPLLPAAIPLGRDA
jgi:glycogen operon protein